MEDSQLIRNGSPDSKATLVLAHGAGAPMDSDFMEVLANGIARHQIQVIRFEFPYMQRRRKAGKNGPPDRMPILLQTWQEVLTVSTSANLFIGGKSMGGRVASMTADQAEVKGLICLGYPFHPPGKPEKLRTEHLSDLKTRTLILQGTRDTFGSIEEVEHYPLSDSIQIKWIEDGDHSFKPRKKSGRTNDQNLNEAIEHSVQFILSQAGSP